MAAVGAVFRLHAGDLGRLPGFLGGDNLLRRRDGRNRDVRDRVERGAAKKGIVGR